MGYFYFKKIRACNVPIRGILLEYVQHTALTNYQCFRVELRILIRSTFWNLQDKKSKISVMLSSCLQNIPIDFRINWYTLRYSALII